MCSLSVVALESNKYQKINFDGGDLSSDAGLLLLKEFASKTVLTASSGVISKPTMMRVSGSIRIIRT